MEATNKMTNIERFHKVCHKNTNIVTTDYIKEILKNHPNFDWEEFNKSYS